MKFLCDQMLGTLAKWLRIYGYDTFYANSEMDDSKLLGISKNENRVLITRDKNLIQTAQKEKIKTIDIKTTDIDEQIKIIISNFKIDKTKILSRCILCNNKIEEIKKIDVKGKVPERIYDFNKKFWFCKKCNKIYWQGSHYQKMFEKINKI